MDHLYLFFFFKTAHCLQTKKKKIRIRIYDTKFFILRKNFFTLHLVPQKNQSFRTVGQIIFKIMNQHTPRRVVAITRQSE